MNNNNTNENESSHVVPEYEHEVPIRGLLHVALQHRWIILFTTLFFLGFAFYYLLKTPPIYTSTSRLYVEQTGPKIMTEYEGVMTQSKNYLYTQAELLKSTPIIAGVFDKSQISKLKTFTNRPAGAFDKVHSLIGYIKGLLSSPPKGGGGEFVDNLITYLKNSLDITVGKNDDIITMSFDSPYPNDAAQVVNAVVSSYIKYHTSRRQNTSVEILRILQKEKVKRNKELSGAFEAMLAFTKENGVVSFGDNQQISGHIVFKRLGKLSNELTSAETETINAHALYQAAQNIASEPEKIRQFALAQPTGGVRVLIDDIETQLRSELKDLKVKLKNATLYGTEAHPYVQSIQLKINQVSQLLRDEESKFADAYLEVMKLKWTSAKQREDSLREFFNIQQQAARNLGVKATEYLVLQSNLKRTEKLCDILDDRIKEINVTEDVGALNISILEVARPAKSPSSPRKTRVMAIALFLGLLSGGGLALVRELTDSRIRSADEILSLLGLSILGVVPKMAGRVKDNFVSHGQKVYLKPNSVTAESYRTIRTAIFYGMPKGKAKTILVTSPSPGDGKTTLVSNLAITMAQANQKTLILDADFRKPMQHNIFEIGNETGLSSVLTGNATLEEALQSGPVDGLEILTCGPNIPNPSEMLSSEAFADLLKSLSIRYDRVIVDSPPVIPVADSQILGAICDIVILVLKAEKSTRKLSQQSIGMLMSVNAHLLGSVVNNVTRKQGKYGYYSGYGHYKYSHYGYGHTEE